MVIRRFKINDIITLHKIYNNLSDINKSYFHPHYFMPKTGIKWLISTICISLCSFSIIQEIIKYNFPNACFIMLVATSKNIIMGMCYLKIKSRYKNGYYSQLGIMIDEKYQNKKIGTMLIKAILAESIKYGIKKIDLEVYKNNISAIKLYQNHGFKIINDEKIITMTYELS